MSRALLSMTLRIGRIFDRTEQLRRRVRWQMGRAIRDYAKFVRVKGRDLIRKRKRPSRPGEPPASHAGFLRRLLLYARVSETVYRVGVQTRAGSKVPGILEWGGTTAIRTRRRGRGSTTTRARIAPRPFIRRARDIERPKVPGLIRKYSLRGGRRR